MTEKKQWKRPQDVVTFRTSDPKEMLGKYMPKHALKTWTEDFLDQDTGETVSIERNQIVVGHRDISPDLNHNGIVDPWERIKACPCFDAKVEYKELNDL